MTWGIFPEQGSKLSLLSWQVDSLLLSHRGSPTRCRSFSVSQMGFFFCGGFILRPALPFDVSSHPSFLFSSKRTGSLILLASPRTASCSPTLSLVPVHECLCPFVNQTSATGLGHGVSPSRLQGWGMHASQQTDAHSTSGGAERKREGRVYVLEEKVEAAAAVNGGFNLLQYGMKAFMCIYLLSSFTGKEMSLRAVK